MVGEGCEMVRGIMIWAHSRCRSTADLYREVIRQAGVPVRIVFREGELECRKEQGFSESGFEDAGGRVVGEDWEAARQILSETVGWTHVVCAYQVSRTFQRVMQEAKRRGDRVVVYSEAPCEMCVGWKALAKRLYYRFVLPRKMRPVVANADLILNQSGMMGMDRLMRLGWRKEQVVPFGYVSGRLVAGGWWLVNGGRSEVRGEGVRVLHLGSEARYRGVEVAERAVEVLKNRKVNVEFRRTGGMLSLAELVAAIRWADVVVACGLCEPWGIRVNDALLEGTPVIVSDGMGAAFLVEKFGCGCVVPKGDSAVLAAALERCATDPDFYARIKSGALRAAQEWTPERRTKEFLEKMR